MKAKFDVTPHLEDLWRYGRVLMRSDEGADDLVQESLVRALSLAGTYDASRPLLPWLIRIVRNTFATRSIRARAEENHLKSYAALSDPGLLPAQEHSAELADVRKALMALPIDQSEVLHLVGVLGLTYAESAEVLAVPIGTVMSRLSRARVALRDILENHKPSHLRIVGRSP